MNQQEIFQNMTKGEWKQDTQAHLLIKAGRSVASFGVQTSNVEDLLPMQQADLIATLTAVNNTYGKGINPESVEKMKDVLEKLKLNYHENTPTRNLIEEALTAAKL